MFHNFKPPPPNTNLIKELDTETSTSEADSLPLSRARKNSKNIKRDCSWITAPIKDAGSDQETKKINAIDAMTKAFAKSIRCALNEVEAQKTVKDRIDSIHFGNLLEALDALAECMKTFRMKQTTKDLEYHSANARKLYQATPPESRDYLANLIQKTANSDSQNKPLTKGFSFVGALEQNRSSPTEAPSEVDKAHAEIGSNSELQKMSQSEGSTDPAVVPGLPTSMITSDKDEVGEETAPKPNSMVAPSEDEKAKKSMFWLCYFVRYMYNVHRLVFQFNYDGRDASSMIFMRYLNPYFKDYYNENRDAKAYLKVLTDYQTEHFLGDDDLGSRLRPKLKSFFSVVEAVMYLWTPAFQEKGVTDAELLYN
eukprot:CAMPEP_0197193516 /NCGR_PEP_ID=MMETSP1423-20130617/27356_1 /TAXON_ID=476441 /ORGANISM="Pseudo-nitzschia heimii, Strain UNC1101" /LENGTH=367 /DNA_ID=CAMNT_0042646727 /DNA_START=64 /DNA_END=1167 /DNA_ORIENTATION=+